MRLGLHRLRTALGPTERAPDAAAPTFHATGITAPWTTAIAVQSHAHSATAIAVRAATLDSTVATAFSLTTVTNP